MSDARLLAPGERDVGLRHGRDAIDLARRLPDICVSAREVASSVMHGVHGRRRAGIGEAFWQFRPFAPGESASRIDWRRSARDDRTYVREREWEAAQTVWLWIDRSPSMAFVSAPGPAVEARSRAGARPGGGRPPGARRRARRPARADPADRLAGRRRPARPGSGRWHRATPTTNCPGRRRCRADRARVLIGDWLSDAGDRGRRAARPGVPRARGAT